jgi:protein SCO1/2
LKIFCFPAFAALLGFLSLAAPVLALEEFKSGVFDPPRVAPEFQLQGSNGSPVSLSTYKGKVVVVAFGFSSCPTICPVTMAKLSQVWKDLGPLADHVQTLFISVDSERDTPERLRKFVTPFHPSFIGLTGTEQDLAKVRESYGIIAQKVASKNKALEYEVHHSSSLHVIDREGKLRVLIPFGTTEADVVHDLKLLLAE